jgi:hypothetical protein
MGDYGVGTHIRKVFVALAVFSGAGPQAALAQSNEPRLEIGVQIPVVASGEFDDTDVGVGGRIAWHPIGLAGVEAEINYYPSDFAEPRGFSRSRLEGLFGVTAGPRIGRIRPFAKVRPGFLQFREAPGPFPCILIFPPPLSCVLASGRTTFALDIGGGVDVAATSRTFLRVDAADRLVRYPGPAFTSGFTRREDGFFSHDFRLAVGGGLRF